MEAELTAGAFREAGLDPAAFAFVPKPGPPTPLRTHLGEDSVFTVAVDEEGRRRNIIELASRTWAAQQGVDCPVIHNAGPTGGWVHASRVRTRPPEGAAYVHAALDAADRIAVAEPPRLPVPPSQWRAGPRSRAVSAARGVLGGLDVVRFLRFRKAAEALSDLTTCHGDFYRRNVLFGTSGRVSVVDWEFVGRAPRWTDHLRLWSTLRRSEDRAEAWVRISSELSPGGAEHFRALAGWLCYRLLAENLAAPSAQRDQQDLAHARAVVADARELIAGLQSTP